ncbi:unnamed protein product [Euphydryas editha]|uniref:Uncharacterized protein n=1 Tax=Euphydryas editha TaxID=104508 RepID=A0AAU9TXW9_EUPED|nr:unnamed protein product [Euphydryas editha]
MLGLLCVLEVYLPYFGHALMALGYILEQFQSVGPPLPSAVVLIGHLCVLTDPRTLSSERPSVQIINIVFLFSNILMFLIDLIRALEYDVPRITEIDQYLT